MEIIRNIFKKNKICSKTLSSLPSNLGGHFERLKILISFNILDLSVIKEIVAFILKSFVDIQNEEFTQLDLFAVLRKEMKRILKNFKETFKKNFTLSSYYQLLNYMIFLIILILNMQRLYTMNKTNHEKNFYEIFFNSDKNTAIHQTDRDTQRDVSISFKHI
jgi:hypothetical protein